MDHAARNESSLVMALRADLADLSQLNGDLSVWPQGVGGQDPRDATAGLRRRVYDEVHRRGWPPAGGGRGL